MPFQDIVEQEHIFALLDKLAGQPNQQAETKFSVKDHLLMKRLWILLVHINDVEKASNFGTGKMSYQRARVARLIWLLEDSDRAYKLAVALPAIKELLYKAWAFDLEIVCGRLKPLVDKGEKFTGNKRGLSALSCELLGILKRSGAKTSEKDVWESLRALAGGKVIDEVTDDEVWVIRNKGPAIMTKRSTVKARLGSLRKLVK